MHSSGRYEAQWCTVRRVHKFERLAEKCGMGRYIKTIKGRQYWYEQTYRPGRRTPLTRYIGPVNPVRKKKRGGGLPIPNPLDLVLYATVFATHIVKYGTGSPKYRSKNVRSGRARQAAQAAAKELFKSYGIDLSSAAAYRATIAHVSQEERWKLSKEFAALGPDARLTMDWPQDDAEARAPAGDREGRQTPQDAPQGPPEAPTYNFTVDDEIEARQAKFEETLDEYNASIEGETGAPSLGPDDAPEPSADEPGHQDGPDAGAAQGSSDAPQ